MALNGVRVPSSVAEKRQASGWQARIRLEFDRRGEHTRLLRMPHSGPLRVQRPFYPEGPGRAHAYLLHPPGALVGGDELQIDVLLAEGADALITTPSAGKVYRSPVQASAQRVSARLAPAARLEWLPHEAILYDGARCRLANCFVLEEGASLLVWDMIALGRAASEEDFLSGDLHNRLEIWRGAQPLLLENFRLQGGSPLLQAPCGLAGHRYLATAAATLSLSGEALDALREQLAPVAPRGRWGLTQLEQLLVLRYLGPCGREARALLEAFRRAVHPLLWDRPACHPRIWNV